MAIYKSLFLIYNKDTYSFKPHLNRGSWLGRCSLIQATRFSDISTYSVSLSMPIQSHPSLTAAISVVPEPQNGSRSIPPCGGFNSLHRYCISFRGLTVGWWFWAFVDCHLSFPASFNIPEPALGASFFSIPFSSSLKSEWPGSRNSVPANCPCLSK